jgi:hypothetical protein
MFYGMSFQNHQACKPGRKALWIMALMVTLLVIADCAGIEPYEPRNHREEGPEQGLFSGSKGEFVIFTRGEEPKQGSENEKASNKAKSPAPREGTQR